LDGPDKGVELVGGVDGLVSSTAQKLTARCGVTSLYEVRNFLSGCFNGAVDYAEPFFKTMEKQHWKDKGRKPITDWKAMAKAYASKAHLRQL
jgi:hypothetical protein